MTATDTAHGVREALAAAKDQHGRSPLERSDERPVLLAFLRHSACPFCQETVRDLRAQRDRFEREGIDVVFVHQGGPEEGDALFSALGAPDALRIADPDRRLYRAFELRRGGPLALFGPKVWFRSISAGMKGYKPVRKVGDLLQLGGIFLIRSGEVIAAFRQRTQADRPDYEELACALPSRR